MTRRNPLIGLHAWTKSIKAIAGKHDLRVSFERGGDTVKINGKNVSIPVPDNRWESKDYDNVLFAVDQYGSMWRYGAEAFSEFSELPPDAPIGWLLREFEQHRTMRKAGEEFKGSREIMGTGVHNRLTDVVLPQLEGMDPKTQAIMEASAEASAHHNKGYASGVGEMMKHVLRNDEGVAILDKLDDIEFDKLLNNTGSVADSLALAKRTFELVWEEDADEQEKKEREKGKGDGDGDGGEQLGGVNPNSGTDATSSDSKGEGEEQGAGPKGMSDGGATEDRDNITGSGAYVITHPEGREFTLEDPDTVRHIDFKKNPEEHPNNGKIAAWARHSDSGATPNAAIFANKLRRLIMVRAAGTYTHGHRRGKLSTKNLYKLAIDHPMPGEDRMFKRKHESDILDTCVEVVVDYSGSMCGEETVLTYEGTRLLTHALQVLNIPCEINMFTTVHAGTMVMTVKHFDERINDEKLLDRCERAAYNMSGNNDSAAMLMCYDRVRQRPEKRKLMLVLSDGQPACGIVSNAEEALQYVVKEIESEGIVEIMGLGVGPHAAVQYYYTQHLSVSDIEQMPTALIDLIANKLLANNE